MTTFNPNHLISLEAAQDFTNFRWHFVYTDSDGKCAMPPAATYQATGIIQNVPITGQAASIMLIGSGGTSKVVLGATLDEGVQVSQEYNSATDVGKAIAATSGSYAYGPLLQGGAEDEIGEVLLASQTVDA
jgi:hypothetical protein